jgi:hypothetical protein
MLEIIQLWIASMDLWATWPDSVFDLTPEQSFAFGLIGFALGAILVETVIVAIGYVALLVWVASDARARGMEGAFLWMALVAFTLFIGLLIYVMVRPVGNVATCSTCENRRLQVSALCPHCGHA